MATLRGDTRAADPPGRHTLAGTGRVGRRCGATRRLPTRRAATRSEAEAAGATVTRFASVIRLRPEKEADYRALHADAWPGVLDALRAAHVANYSIFLRDGTLFSYLEYTGDDYAADMARLAEDKTTQRWWQLTDPCQQPVASAADGEWWAPAEEVFHLD